MPPHTNHRLFIVIAVLGFHVLALWALQTGLLRRAVELVVPVMVLAEMIEPPRPQAVPAPPEPQHAPVPAPRQHNPSHALPSPAPQPVAIVDSAPVQQVPTGVTAPQPPAALVQAAAIAADPIPAPPAAAPAKIELPSSSAAYLNNPPPSYPPLSRRLGEQGKVVVRAFIETNGTASQPEIHTSSGYERLDQAALQTVLKWRYMPGKRASVPEAMWFNIPISFVLEQNANP